MIRKKQFPKNNVQESNFEVMWDQLRISRQEIASLKILPVYKSTPQFENISE